jgi:hypothetical protein
MRPDHASPASGPRPFAAAGGVEGRGDAGSRGPLRAYVETEQASVGLGERRLAALLELGRSLVEDLDLELVLKRVLDAARELTGGALCGAGDPRRATRAARAILDGRRR